MVLTPKQLSGLRYYDPEDEYVTAPPHPRTRTSLESSGLLDRDDDDGLRLSVWGKQMIREYVASSGNGPEDLKAMFRF